MNFFEELKNKITDILPSNNLDFLEIGDIIWAKRYSTEKERITIETGHQQGPFIIIHKENKKVYGLYCTSSTRKDTNKFHYLILDKNQYKLKLFKTTYIQTTTDREIKYSQYIRKIGHLTDKDLNHLLKIIYIMKIHEPQNLSLHIEEKDLCYNIEIGDIIKKKQSTYLVYNIDNDYYYLHHTNEAKNSKGNVSYNGKKFSINLIDDIKLSKDNKVTVEYFIDKSQFKELKLLKQQMLKQKEESKIIKRGSLVKYDSKLYLIYGEFKDNWQAYLIYTVNSKPENSLALNIDNIKFFTLFETILIPKDDNLRTDKFASDEEIDKIKYIKKSVKTINSQNYIPYKTTTKNDLLSLSKQQEILVLKLKTLNYNENEIIAIMIKLNQKYQIEELLDYFVKLEKEYDKIDKEIVTQKITQMLKNTKTQY